MAVQSRFLVMRTLPSIAAFTLCIAILLSPLLAKGQIPSKAGWTTSSEDPARDAWQRGPSDFSPQSVGGVQLLWKTKLHVKTMGMQSFREPLILPDVKTASGNKTVVIMVGASNEVYALDADSGSVLWQTTLKWSSSQAQEPGEGRGFICTNALTANPVATAPDSGSSNVYLIGSDGYLHSLDAGTGEENKSPIQVFDNPYPKPYGLNLYNNVIFTTTGQRCGGDANELYAVNLTDGKASHSDPGQGGIWGVAGPAIDSQGDIFFTSGDGPYDVAKGLLATTFQGYTFSDDKLTLKDYYTPTNYEWLTERDLDVNATPVIFPWHGQDVLVGSGKEGKYYLVSTTDMGGKNHETPLYRTPLFSNANVNFQTEGTWGSLASWQDNNGTRWILAPIGGPTAVNFPTNYGPTPDGGIIAMKLIERDGAPHIEPVWRSRNMMTAEPPIIVNGVIFVLAGGEFTGQANDAEGGLYSSEQRIEKSQSAKLYALDAETGKELYSSGDQISSFLHQAGPSTAGNQVIFGTFDGTVYSFGLKSQTADK